MYKQPWYHPHSGACTGTRGKLDALSLRQDLLVVQLCSSGVKFRFLPSVRGSSLCPGSLIGLLQHVLCTITAFFDSIIRRIVA